MARKIVSIQETYDFTDSLRKELSNLRDDKYLENISTFVDDLCNAQVKFSKIRPQADLWITHYGSARLKEDHPNYQLAQAAGKILGQHNIGAITGGGPGIMEAPFKGLVEINKKIFFGFNVKLNNHEVPNPILVENPQNYYVFNNFLTRKYNLTYWSNAYLIHMGGFGTEDEDTENRTLVQTCSMTPRPIGYMDIETGHFWQHKKEMAKIFLEAGLINEEDLEFFKIYNRPEDFLKTLQDFYRYYLGAYQINDHKEIVFVFNNNFYDGLEENIYNKLKITPKVINNDLHPNDIYDQKGSHISFPNNLSWYKKQNIICLINNLLAGQN